MHWMHVGRGEAIVFNRPSTQSGFAFFYGAHSVVDVGSGGGLDPPATMLKDSSSSRSRVTNLVGTSSISELLVVVRGAGWNKSTWTLILQGLLDTQASWTTALPNKSVISFLIGLAATAAVSDAHSPCSHGGMLFHAPCPRFDRVNLIVRQNLNSDLRIYVLVSDVTKWWRWFRSAHTGRRKITLVFSLIGDED